MKTQLLFGLGLAWLTACHATGQEADTVAEISKAAVDDVPQTHPVSEPEIENASALLVNTVAHAEEPVAVESPEQVSPQDPIVSEVSYPAITLRRGETLAHYARWSGVPVEKIAEASFLELDGQYSVGTEIVLPITDETFALVESKRETHRVKRVEGYLQGRGGSERSEFYTVKTGDTAWHIAKASHAIPVWVLEHYNPSVNLDRLRPGQQLMVPVLADTVVDAE